MEKYLQASIPKFTEHHSIRLTKGRISISYNADKYLRLLQSHFAHNKPDRLPQETKARCEWVLVDVCLV